MDLNTRCSQREADTEGDTGCDLPFTGSVLNTQIHGDRKRVLVARGRGGGGAGGVALNEYSNPSREDENVWNQRERASEQHSDRC